MCLVVLWASAGVNSESRFLNLYQEESGLEKERKLQKATLFLARGLASWEVCVETLLKREFLHAAPQRFWFRSVAVVHMKAFFLFYCAQVVRLKCKQIQVGAFYYLHQESWRLESFKLLGG